MPIASPLGPISLEHLCLFLTADGGRPVQRMPVYAEIGLAAPVRERPIALAFDELHFSTLSDIDADAADDHGARDRIRDAMWRALGATLDDETIDSLLRPPGSELRELLTDVMERLRKAAAGASLATLDLTPGDRRVEREMRTAAERRDLVLLPPVDRAMTWSYPLGSLASDHVGYVSFDLSRLPASVRDALREAARARLDGEEELGVGLLVYPYGLDRLRFDAFAQGRIMPGAVVARADIVRPIGLLLPEAPDGAPSMQNPSLLDWRLSGASFVANPTAFLGADGCEQIFPAQLAVQEYSFYQVVGLHDVTLPNVPANVADSLRAGFVQEYRTTWHSLGHSLGRILYSLPLAPGESVNLAVIDWRRQDQSQREEATTVAEQLIHRQTRDRTVTETVTAALDEWQRGGSVMGGIGGSMGGAGWGASAALGGGYSTSSGSRDIAAQTVQKLSDNIAQASSSFRELNSTVVIETAQTEHETIETRTVANYNHSHSLTVLYYEVLRHFRVVTELVRRRPVVLVRSRTDWFTASDAALVSQNIREHRPVLQAALLDPRHAAGLDAVESRARREARAGPPPPPPQPPPVPPVPLGEAARAFRYFCFEVKTGGFHSQMDEPDERVDVLCTLVLADGSQVELVSIEGNSVLTTFGSFRFPDSVNSFTAVPKGGTLVLWDTISSLRLAVAVFPTNGETAKVSFASIKIVGIDGSGPPGVVLLDQQYNGGHLIIKQADAEKVRQPLIPMLRPPFFAPVGRSAEDLEDEVRSKELLAHLIYNAAVYNRAILLGRNAAQRASELDAIKLNGGATVLERVENRPLELIGAFVAYPLTDEAWSAAIVDSLAPAEEITAPLAERLITFPTRGVFAEGKLGHCNLSEEIDNTRFWDWQKSPIPHMAPAIKDIGAVTPAVQAPAGLTPSAFPAAMVNIVPPPAAPDPVGLAAALKVLGTADIFRDMSTAKQVSDLLQALVKASAPAGAGGAGGGSGGGAPAGGGSGGGAGAGSGAGGTPGTTRPVALAAPRSVAELNDLATGIQASMPPAEARPLVRELYTNAVHDAGAVPAGPDARDTSYVLIFGLSTTGTSQVGNFPLGINPGGQFNNAVDIAAKNTRVAFEVGEAHKAPHTEFRWRQTASQKSFEFVAGGWKQVFHSQGSLADDPDPSLQKVDAVRGWLRMFDSPGWPSSPLVGPATPTLDLGGNVKSSAAATEVVVKMFLQTWVEGRIAAGPWERVSKEVLEWCSVQWLKRTGPAASWATTPGTVLVSGGQALREFAKAPDDVDI